MEIIFETPRLFLREFTLEDAGLLYELNSDPEVLRYLHEPLVQDEQHARTVIESILMPQYERKLGRWAAFLKEDRSFIGWCGLKYLPEQDEIDLGYRLMKVYWGKGYATEAAADTLHYGFRHLQLEKITACAHIDNLASQKVLEKSGMKYIGDAIVDDCPVKKYILLKDNTQKPFVSPSNMQVL